jgi:four helix bundle protein
MRASSLGRTFSSTAAGQPSSGRYPPSDAAQRGRGDTATWRKIVNIRSYRELDVYRSAMDAAMHVFEITKTFPQEEKYSLVDQVRRSSRSICANLAEAWRKRRYEAHFVSKMSDAESEAEETRVWLEFAYKCSYISQKQFEELDDTYDKIVAQLVKMLSQPDKWRIR